MFKQLSSGRPSLQTADNSPSSHTAATGRFGEQQVRSLLASEPPVAPVALWITPPHLLEAPQLSSPSVASAFSCSSHKHPLCVPQLLQPQGLCTGHILCWASLLPSGTSHLSPQASAPSPHPVSPSPLCRDVGEGTVFSAPLGSWFAASLVASSHFTEEDSEAQRRAEGHRGVASGRPGVRGGAGATLIPVIRPRLPPGAGHRHVQTHEPPGRPQDHGGDQEGGEPRSPAARQLLRPHPGVWPGGLASASVALVYLHL